VTRGVHLQSFEVRIIVDRIFVHPQTQHFIWHKGNIRRMTLRGIRIYVIPVSRTCGLV
jgi:hypothetical protein